MTKETISTDVLVVGAGNAAFAAASSAREAGVSVLVIDCAPRRKPVEIRASPQVPSEFAMTVLRTLSALYRI